jgi:NhaA family Na+:H+ antiporter
MGLDDFLHLVSICVAAGLFPGIQLSAFGFSWVAIRLGVERLLDGVSLGSLYGVSVLCGIGFTMSMFVGSLAFESQPSAVQILFDERIGIMIGSLVLAAPAAIFLNVTLSRKNTAGV